MVTHTPPLFTPGAAALDAACRLHGSEVAVVRVLSTHGCVVSQQQFNRWRRGLARPEEDKWPSIHAALGIAPHLWLTDAARESLVSVLASGQTEAA